MTDDNVCYHESAHAVAAKLLGLRVAHVTVHPDHPCVRTLHRSDDPDAPNKLAIVDLAATGIEPDIDYRATDERRAFGHAQKIAMDEGRFGEDFDGLPEATAKVQDELRNFAQQLIKENMPLVERVAKALVHNITLNEAQINELLR